MDIVTLLQQVGPTPYESGVYHTLLQQGPLTGYQLGKRSRVPLPCGYAVLVLEDDREVLAGTATVDRSQAVVTGNRALVAMAQSSFLDELPRQTLTRASETYEAANDWLAWEGQKQKRLRPLIGGSDVA